MVKATFFWIKLKDTFIADIRGEMSTDVSDVCSVRFLHGNFDVMITSFTHDSMRRLCPHHMGEYLHVPVYSKAPRH